MKRHRELRFFKSKVELRAITAEQTAAGYIGEMRGFIPYASDSREMRTAKGEKFVERLAPGVFTRSLADPKQVVFADVGHDDSATFARSGVNLTLEDSPAGLAWTALLPDTTVGRDLKANVALGIIDGTSFEFELRSEAGAEEVAKRDGLAIRTIRDAILHRVNPVTEPAYLETELATRAARRGEGRSYISYQNEDYLYGDPTITPDIAFALEQLGREMSEFQESLDYLRAAPAGALRDYATRQAAESQACLTELTAWLGANGGSVDPAMLERARQKMAEHRSAPAPEISEDAREMRLRLLTA